MEEELQHLLEQDIIEKVNEPTGWVSPPVVTPKKDQSQIRLNVDMRVANHAIPRRYTQHPTLDDVINELSGSTVFSHLDMCKGYHQLELKEESRNVTTFSTHVGLYRYKRLNYGTRSAAEIFQETVREDRKVTPGWAEANGDLDRFMQRVKKTARIAKLHVREEVCRGVRAYRATQHATTGVSPNNLMFGRELRGKFPEFKKRLRHPDDSKVRNRDRKQKEEMKKYADKRRHTAVKKIEVGDTVL